jgi:hypothetical protein
VKQEGAHAPPRGVLAVPPDTLAIRGEAAAPLLMMHTEQLGPVEIGRVAARRKGWAPWPALASPAYRTVRG